MADRTYAFKTGMPPITFLDRKDPQAHSSAELLEIAKTMVIEEFRKHGTINPTFMFDNPPGGYTTSMQTAWTDTAEKAGVALAVRKMLEFIKAERYAIITEAWYVSVEVDKDTSAGEAYRDATKGPLPSEHPDRKECITIIVWGSGPEPLGHMFEIKRRVNSRPVLVDSKLNPDGLIDMRFGKLNPTRN